MVAANKTALRRATQDEVGLAFAVEERYKSLFGSWLQHKGTTLRVPATLRKEVSAWRRFLMRCQQGNFEISEDEKKGMQVFAQWTVSKNCELRNQPDKKIEWSD